MTKEDTYHVVDYQEKILLFSGSLEECNNYADELAMHVDVVHENAYRDGEYYIDICVIPPIERNRRGEDSDDEDRSWVVHVDTPTSDADHLFDNAADAYAYAVKFMAYHGFEPKFATLFGKKITSRESTMIS